MFLLIFKYTSTLKSPQLRGTGGSGYLFIVTIGPKDVLIEDCEAYRGRHNFSVGGWGTSGIVFNKIDTEGGWVFGATDVLLDQLGLTDRIPTQLKYYTYPAGGLFPHGE